MKGRWLVLAGAILAVGGTLAAVLLAGGSSGSGGSEEAARVRTGSEREADRRRRRAGGGARDRRRGAAAVPAAVTRLAARLPLERQVAQLFVVGFAGTTVSAPIFEDIQARGWGGIVVGPENYVEPGQLAALAGEAGVVARNAGQVRPLVAAARDLQGAQPAGPGERAARDAAVRLHDAGFSLVLAPVADVSVPGGPAEEQSFGDDPQLVARHVRAAVTGWRAGGVLPAVGHFPGQGAASQDPLEGPSSVGLTAAELRDRDLVPFRAVARTAPAIVISNAAYAAYDPVTPAALTTGIVRGLLRGTLAFRGVAMSDDLSGAPPATGTTVAEAAVDALRAGIDLLYVPDPAEVAPAYAASVRAVRGGSVPAARVREALLRVLAMKHAAGLLA